MRDIAGIFFFHCQNKVFAVIGIFKKDILHIGKNIHKAQFDFFKQFFIVQIAKGQLLNHGKIRSDYLSFMRISQMLRHFLIDQDIHFSHEVEPENVQKIVPDFSELSVLFKYFKKTFMNRFGRGLYASKDKVVPISFKYLFFFLIKNFMGDHGI
ncbi:hypothetical protein SDC9_138513 [bioreactor metagenome]|uniref:Uncharacterized protein n=1 Tax=bioreactor metagenome TaxID=1076179 RepID=A0A645DQ48_9ZZZZ